MTVTCTLAEWLTHGPALVRAGLAAADIRFTDAHPVGYPTGYGWLGPETNPTAARHARVPAGVFDHLADGGRWFPTAEAAAAALTRAAVAWATTRTAAEPAEAAVPPDQPDINLIVVERPAGSPLTDGPVPFGPRDFFASRRAGEWAVFRAPVGTAPRRFDEPLADYVFRAFASALGGRRPAEPEPEPARLRPGQSGFVTVGRLIYSAAVLVADAGDGRALVHVPGGCYVAGGRVAGGRDAGLVHVAPAAFHPTRAAAEAAGRGGP